jgi:hypothetical protein
VQLTVSKLVMFLLSAFADRTIYAMLRGKEVGIFCCLPSFPCKSIFTDVSKNVFKPGLALILGLALKLVHHE